MSNIDDAIAPFVELAAAKIDKVYYEAREKMVADLKAKRIGDPMVAVFLRKADKMFLKSREEELKKFIEQCRSEFATIFEV